MNEVPPVFIGGAGRSGTTLLADVLGLHPRFSPVYETEFVILLARLLLAKTAAPLAEIERRIVQCMDDWTRPLPSRPHSKREYERFHHGPHHVRFTREFALQRTDELLSELRAGRRAEALRRFVTALFCEHCRQDGKLRWINKTPAYVLCLPQLRQVFPDMRFIHCIRDGRDAACSAMTRHWGPSDFRQAATWWLRNVKPGVAFGRAYPAQYFEVRYEDLVRAPADCLGRLLAWLGEPGGAEEMLVDYHQRGVRLDPSRIGDWERTWSPADRVSFSNTAGGMLAHFGYGP